MTTSPDGTKVLKLIVTTAIERMPTHGRSSAEPWGSSRQKHRLNSLNLVANDVGCRGHGRARRATEAMALNEALYARALALFFRRAEAVERLTGVRLLCE